MMLQHGKDKLSETSVANYQPRPRNIPEERRLRLHLGSLFATHNPVIERTKGNLTIVILL